MSHPQLTITSLFRTSLREWQSQWKDRQAQDGAPRSSRIPRVLRPRAAASRSGTADNGDVR